MTNNSSSTPQQQQQQPTSNTNDLFSGLQTKSNASPAKEEPAEAKKKDLYGGFIDLNNLGKKEDEDADKPSYLKKSTQNSGGVYIKDSNTT